MGRQVSTTDMTSILHGFVQRITQHGHNPLHLCFQGRLLASCSEVDGALGQSSQVVELLSIRHRDRLRHGGDNER